MLVNLLSMKLVVIIYYLFRSHTKQVYTKIIVIKCHKLRIIIIISKHKIGTYKNNN